MSLPREEANALDAAFQFLLDLSSGREKRIPNATRKRARAVVKHYPLAAGQRWTKDGQRECTSARGV